jgi:hypothetical protein
MMMIMMTMMMIIMRIRMRMIEQGRIEEEEGVLVVMIIWINTMKERRTLQVKSACSHLPRFLGLLYLGLQSLAAGSLLVVGHGTSEPHSMLVVLLQSLLHYKKTVK